MVTTKLNIKQHLAEYCIGKWGSDFKEPVRFPAGIELYVSLYSLTIKRPKNITTEKGNLEVVIPVRREKDEVLGIYKNPNVYNYISERGSRILQRQIEALFWAELHTEINQEHFVKGRYIKDAVYTFMCKYRIKSITEDALLKNYQRWRSKINKKKKRNYKKSCC